MASPAGWVLLLCLAGPVFAAAEPPAAVVDGSVRTELGADFLLAAVMFEPFADGGNGLQLWTQEELNRTVAAYDAAGLQVELHAIGEGAVRMALDAYEHADRANGARDALPAPGGRSRSLPAVQGLFVVSNL